MADDPNTPAPDPGADPNPKPDPQPDDAAAIAAAAKDPEAVEKALRSERAAAREARKKAEAAEAKVREYEDRDKSASERAETRAKDAEDRAVKAELKALRLEVATAKELPSSLAGRLQGNTQEELEADADQLLKDFEASTGNTGGGFAGGARGPGAAPRTFDDELRGSLHR